MQNSKIHYVDYNSLFFPTNVVLCCSLCCKDALSKTIIETLLHHSALSVRLSVSDWTTLST